MVRMVDIEGYRSPEGLESGSRALTVDLACIIPARWS